MEPPIQRRKIEHHHDYVVRGPGVKEVAKYAGGALLGGVATMAFLVSPLCDEGNRVACLRSSKMRCVTECTRLDEIGWVELWPAGRAHQNDTIRLLINPWVHAYSVQLDGVCFMVRFS